MPRATKRGKAKLQEATKRVTESPLARMKRSRSLNVWELTAADEIVAAYQMSIGEPCSRDIDLGIPPPEMRTDAADDRAAHGADLVRVFSAWRASIASTEAFAATRAILLQETPMREVERLNHWRNGTARTHLLAGLRHFAALRGNTPRSARGWKIIRP